MKRFISSIFLLTFLCLAAWSQPRLTSNKETHTLGQIEWKRPVTVEYVITNTGDKPLVLSNITTSCACAVAEWTQTPIMAGEKGSVKVTFDAKALGHFHKSVGIYSNASPSLVYLYFTGEVVQKITDFSNLHPHKIGDILIDKVELDFPDVHLGENPVIQLSVVNLTDRPYEPVLMHLPAYLDAVAEPKVLLKGERGNITVTLATNRLPDLGLTQASVYLARFAGDKVSDESEIPVSVVLLPDRDDFNYNQATGAPAIKLSETTVDLSGKLAKKDQVRHDITITNTGKTALEIIKLQLFDPAVGVDLKKNLLKPGEKTRLRVTVDKQLLSKKRHPRILMITNDPENPKVVIDLKINQ